MRRADPARAVAHGPRLRVRARHDGAGAATVPGHRAADGRALGRALCGGSLHGFEQCGFVGRVAGSWPAHRPAPDTDRTTVTRGRTVVRFAADGALRVTPIAHPSRPGGRLCDWVH